MLRSEVKTDGEKTCRKCKLTLPVWAFGLSKCRDDGYDLWCRECWAVYNRERRAAKPKVSHKTCIKCNENKPAEKFSLHGTSRDGLQKWCKDCARQYAHKTRAVRLERCKSWYKARTKEERLDISLRQSCREYGITRSDYIAILESQGGVCAICGGLSSDKRLAIDHCHKTDAVRGLLCDRCNQMLGFAKDDEEILSKGIEYLRKNGGGNGLLQ